MTTNRALIIVDVQNDFCEGGSLAVAGGAETARRITNYVNWCQRHSLSQHIQRYQAVVATADWHIRPGEHFASTLNEEPDYTTTWPDHCVAGTPGANLHPNLDVELDLIVYKGMLTAAYSGFEGIYATDLVGRVPGTLDGFLRERNIDSVDVVGIAYDYCVAETAIDAVRLGFSTNVLYGLTASVRPSNDEQTTKALLKAGVRVGPHE